MTVTPLPPTPQSSRVSPSTCSAVNVIDHTAMCLSRNDVRALDRSIACFMCAKQFHAICQGDGLNGSLKGAGGGLQEIFSVIGFWLFLIEETDIYQMLLVP